MVPKLTLLLFDQNKTLFSSVYTKSCKWNIQFNQLWQSLKIVIYSLKCIYLSEYNIDRDRTFLEDLLEKGRDANDKLYAELLLKKESIQAVCENPYSTQGWYHRRSSLNRRISVISEVSLTFVYGKQPEWAD